MSRSSLPRVLVTRTGIPESALARLKRSCETIVYPSRDPIPKQDLMKQIGNADGLYCLITDTIDRDVLKNAGSRLRVIGTMSVGYDHIDVAACREKNIHLGYTPDVLTEATAELTVTLLLCAARRVFEASETVFKGTWSSWHPMTLTGKGIQGTVVGMIGLGRIGSSVVQKIHPFKPQRVVYCCRQRKPEQEEKELGVECVDLNELLRISDYVVVTCSFNDSTKNLINSEALSLMKDDAVLVNSSRGGVVDQEALYTALKEGLIGCAALDVCTPEPLPPDHKLLTLPNLIIFPHIGSATVSARTAMAELTVDNILAGLEGRPLPCPVPL